MAKCFLTGIEVPLDKAYLLDRGAAQRALRNLRQRIAAVERLVSQLGPKDDVPVFDPKLKTTRTRLERRLVCPTVATALSSCYPEAPLFVSWCKFTFRPAVFPEFRNGREPAAQGGNGTNGRNGGAPTRPTVELASPVADQKAAHAGAQ
jgi:hypothetical protein